MKPLLRPVNKFGFLVNFFVSITGKHSRACSAGVVEGLFPMWENSSAASLTGQDFCCVFQQKKTKSEQISPAK